MILATLLLCVGPGLLSIHGHCFATTHCISDRECGVPVHPVLRVVRPPCEISLQFDKAKGFPTKTREVLHDDGACVRPYAFLLGGTGNLMEIRDESALIPPILEKMK